MSSLDVVLTGDRPTGPLHLGHYAGSLKNRINLQHRHKQFVLIADVQGLTDNADDPVKVRRSVLEVTLDYLAVGIDPELSVICVQSGLPALAELSLLYMNFVTVARLERNPTVKREILLRGFERNIPAGFLCYPVSQAADITAFKATLVPVGEDQLPMIEQSNEIVRRINRQANRPVLPESRALVGSVGRLPGVDGKSKMSKSSGNAISLSATPLEISQAVQQMYTDPDHVRASDPGRVEGNVVFAYLDAFDHEHDELKELKSQYRRGGLGDVALKGRLEIRLQELLAPIRERRLAFAEQPDFVMDVIREGTKRARHVTQATIDELKDGLCMFRFC